VVFVRFGGLGESATDALGLSADSGDPSTVLSPTGPPAGESVESNGDE
jgi:hypothetical protein